MNNNNNNNNSKNNNNNSFNGKNSFNCVGYIIDTNLQPNFKRV